MEKEQLEHISIIIEIVAFFFVTVDLYGAENLKKIPKIAISILVYPSIVIFMFLTYRTFTIYFPELIPQQLSEWGDLNAFTFKFWAVAAIITLIFLGLSAAIIWASWRIVLFSTVFILKWLQHWPTKGIMICIGAILFVVAKLMAYFATSLHQISN